jgi:predicted permease
VLTKIFAIIFPLFAIAGTGYAYGRWRRPDMSFANRLNMDVFVPALIFYVLSGKSFELQSYAMLGAGVVLVIAIVGALLTPLVWASNMHPRTVIPPMLFKNVGNMGLPLAVFTFGERALPAAVVIFIISSVLHFTLGTYIMYGRAGWLWILKVPVIQATAAGVVFSLTGWTLPQALATPIEMLSRVSIPLLLFSLGVRLTDIDLRDWRIGVAGALLCPVAGVGAAALTLWLLPLPPVQAQHLLVYGALPPAVLNYILAEVYRREPKKVASVVLLGNMLSLVSIPAVLALVLN